MSDVTLRDDEQVLVSLTTTDDQGNPTTYQAPDANIASSDDTTVTVTNNNDGTFTVATTGKVATGITLSASGTGPDGNPLTGATASVDVVTSNPVAEGFAFGSPTPRPNAPAPNPTPTPPSP